MFWNGSTAIDGLSGNGRAGRSSSTAVPTAINPHPARNILQVLLADILEPAIEPARRRLLHDRRNQDAAGLRQRLQPRRHVDAVAVDIVSAHHHVADIDADAQPHRVVRVQPHLPLHVERAPHRLDRAGEFGEHAVAGVLHQPAAGARHRGVDHLAAQRLQPRQRAGLVGAHHARIADHVGGQDGGEAAGGHSGIPAARKGRRTTSRRSLLAGSASGPLEPITWTIAGVRRDRPACAAPTTASPHRYDRAWPGGLPASVAASC